MQNLTLISASLSHSCSSKRASFVVLTLLSLMGKDSGVLLTPEPDPGDPVLVMAPKII